MRLTRIYCDGCGRVPGFWEWIRGELTQEGYPDWRHPGIVFRSAGCPLTFDNRARCEYLFQAIFDRSLPDEAGYLCPRCQDRAEEELPGLMETYRPQAAAPAPPPRHYLGRKGGGTQ